MIPPEQNGSFVAHMERVLDIYERPFDPQRPVVCMDESPKQLIAETRVPIPGSPGRVARHDYEYRRSGVCTVFLACEPLATHVPGSLYETFAPDKAKALWDRFEFVYTPKHGSWLNMAEMPRRGLSVSARDLPSRPLRRLPATAPSSAIGTTWCGRMVSRTRF